MGYVYDKAIGVKTGTTPEATNGGIDLTENERVKFIQGDAVAALRQMKDCLLYTSFA